ncbi:hypothetical protein [Aerolutibacter ruishenii]|uniref:Uncharacterized protein n=1 Tax=Aerolutibacter ruishenii TaxID=686800 RepID=A0A562M0E9_9GAMM|nr:hypothetical protein [Lysobacter ruishenii]TWI13414.1 hypothetical protein IP93_00576 [Lysobacter ruishenii]
MNALHTLPDRALGLANAVGDGLKHALPAADKWLQTGAKLGALKGGARVATTMVRRHPFVAVATVAGVGLLWYAARRKAREAEANAPIEGTARRVEAKKSARKQRSTARSRDDGGSDQA